MDAQTARQKLEDKLIPYTEESYLNYARLGKVRIVNLFITAGIDVDTQDRYQNTALSLAAENGKKSVVKLLISAGANIDGDSEWLHPLLRAIEKGHSEIAEMLINAGASIYVKDDANWTALLHAVGRNLLKLTQRLIGAGLDVNHRGKGWGRSYNALELTALTLCI